MRDARAQKISDTMRARKLDNFKQWRDEMKRAGKIKSSYPQLKRNGDLAELTGVILGDGHIQKFPRTERLLIFSNANNPGFVKRYALLVEKVFKKKPYVYKQTDQNCVRIGIYEKNIAKRLEISTGARKQGTFPVPKWIFENKTYVVRYLRGLYEAEGSESHHPPTSTHKFSFANRNESLLENVSQLMQGLGFYLSKDKLRVQISRKAHVERAVRLLQFRKY